MPTHDIIKHVQYLKQSLSQDRKPVGFFISAGCPLSIEVPNWPLIPDVRNLTIKITNQLCSKTATKNNYDLLLDQLEKSSRNRENIEDILSFIRALKEVSKGENVRGFSENDLITLEEEICREIVKLLQVELPNKDTPYHNLSTWINSFDRVKPIEVFTTNYDLLLEQALEESAVPYFDGFVGGRYPFFDLRAIEENLIPHHWTRLWKIHGSINWILKNDNEVYRSTASNDVKPYHLIYPSHLKYDQSRKMPYLALIDQLTKFLKQNQALLILCGYSFNDFHLNATIVNALKANSSASVIAFLYGPMKTNDEAGNLVESYPNAIKIANRHNLSLWSFDEAIIGTLRGNWKITKNKDGEEFDNPGGCIYYNKEERLDDTGIPTGIFDETTHLKLGDFSIAGKFLQELTGTNNLNSLDAK